MMERIKMLEMIYYESLTVEDALCCEYYNYIMDMILNHGMIIDTTDGVNVARLEGNIGDIHYIFDVQDDVINIYEDGDLIINAECDTCTDYTVEDYKKYKSIVTEIVNNKLGNGIKEGLKELKVQMKELNEDLKETSKIVKLIKKKLGNK